MFIMLGLFAFFATVALIVFLLFDRIADDDYDRYDDTF